MIYTLCDDVYNIICKHVTYVEVIKNMRLTNKRMLEGIKNVECIYDSVPIEFLFEDERSTKLAFPSIKRILGDIIIEDYYKQATIKDVHILTILKKIYKPRIRQKCDLKTKSYKVNLLFYSSIIEFIKHLTVSYEDESGRYELYNMNRAKKKIRIEFTDAQIDNINIDRIFVPIVGYEYLLVLNSYSDSLLFCSYINTNISSVVCAQTSKFAFIPWDVTKWQSIQTIIIESELSEVYFHKYNKYHGISLPQIKRIVTNYDLCFSVNQNDEISVQSRIERILYSMSIYYVNAKIEIKVDREYYNNVSNYSILKHPNALITFV